jgi:hypothetical protein
MGRKRRDEDQVSEQKQRARRGRRRRVEEQVPEEAPRSRRGRKLAILLALAGAAAYLVRRNQRKAELDEGIWHEAPAPATAAPASSAAT